ncbi:MAG: hypothetical protein GC179_23300 [Anaerolineaceae bacterium]|nr:hypothetical protein [Anaerolineaceae bacterium]
MREYQLGEVVLEREFETTDSDGNIGLVKLLIGKAYRDTEPPFPWCSPFQIIGVGDEKVRGVWGFDSIQALTDSLPVIKAYLRVFAKDQQKTITWLGMDDLGLPDVKRHNDQT